MYTTQTVENQEVMWLPTNKDTQTIGYDTTFLKSAPGRYPALKWKISKIEDTASLGISRFTMTQEQFDPAKDNVDLMIADYWENSVEPDISCDQNISKKISIKYSGKPSVRAGGGFKKFICIDEENPENILTNIKWNISFDEFNDKIKFETKDNYIRLKCVDDYSLIGKTFILSSHVGNSNCELMVEVTSL